MLLRLFSMLAFSLACMYACDCITVPAPEAKRYADVVFRGTITSFHDSGKGYPIAVFQVSRVWKVKETFEMPALKESGGCFGFLPRLEIGSELIVYAHKIVPSDSDYFPVVCNSLLVKDVKDIAKLGSGKKPSAKEPTSP